MKNLNAAVMWAAALGSATAASAQWTVVSLHPAGALSSSAWGIHDGQVGGHAVFAGEQHAVVWNDFGMSWVDLHPAGATGSLVHGVHNGLQSGSIRFGDVYHASRWSGTSASHVDLHPDNAISSQAFGIDGGIQAGYVEYLNNTFACVWNGYAVSARELTFTWTPSVAYGIQDGNVVVSNFSAWQYNLSDSTFTFLYGDFELTAWAWDVHNGQQVGAHQSFPGPPPAATMWSGSISSTVFLTPNPGVRSEAFGVFDGYQVGMVNHRACIWQGSAQTYEDISFANGLSLGDCEAHDAWHDGTTLYVTGEGLNLATGLTEALLWSRPIDAKCYADCDNNTVLDVADYVCFGNAYAANDPYADCDGNTTLNILDYICFGNAYAGGCP